MTEYIVSTHISCQTVLSVLLRGMNCKVGLQNAVQDLFLRGDAGHNFVNLSNNGSKEGCRAEKEKDAVYLQFNIIRHSR